jgi:hypothetical protein
VKRGSTFESEVQRVWCEGDWLICTNVRVATSTHCTDKMVWFGGRLIVYYQHEDVQDKASMFLHLCLCQSCQSTVIVVWLMCANSLNKYHSNCIGVPCT